MRKIYLLILIVMLGFPVLSQACAQKDGGFFCRNTTWDNLSAATLTISQFSGKVLQYDFGKNAMEISVNSENNASHFWVFDPGVYLYPKQMAMEQNQEFDAVEASMGLLRLSSYLLNVAFPAGPSAIKNKSTIEVESQTKGIELIIDPGTVGRYYAPWSARGTILPLSAHKFKYSIDFKFHSKQNQEENLVITGEMDFSPMTFAMPNSLSVVDYNIEVFAKPDMDLSSVKTIGELRRVLSKHKGAH